MLDPNEFLRHTNTVSENSFFKRSQTKTINLLMGDTMAKKKKAAKKKTKKKASKGKKKAR